MKFHHFLLFLGLGLGQLSAQQLPGIHHYRILPYLYNPAMTGQDTVQQVFLGHRQHWLGFPDGPWTQTLGLSLRPSGSSIGLGAVAQRSDLALFSRLHARLQAAAHIGDMRKGHLSVGGYMGVLDWQVDMSKANVVEVLNPNLGIALDAGLGLAWTQRIGDGRLQVDAAVMNLMAGDYTDGGAFSRQRNLWGRVAVELPAGGLRLTPFVTLTEKKNGGPAAGMIIQPDNPVIGFSLGAAPMSSSYFGSVQLQAAEAFQIAFAANVRPELGLSLEGGLIFRLGKSAYPLPSVKVPKPPKATEPEVITSKPEPPKPVNTVREMDMTEHLSDFEAPQVMSSSKYNGPFGESFTVSFADPDENEEQYRLDAFASVDSLREYLAQRIAQAKKEGKGELFGLEVAMSMAIRTDILERLQRGEYRGDLGSPIDIAYFRNSTPGNAIQVKKGDRLNGEAYVLLKLLSLSNHLQQKFGLGSESVKLHLNIEPEQLISRKIEVKMWLLNE